ncbi:Clp protease N-terminal domain-containing protein [Plantactinospora solaniradicis]|uniref:Clp protease N-terminal domain-containing protein n=1 Tax=Plantactinospora solaniradicis TaxID=1723736 RepID=A0ABW1KNV1_9ACTN
MEELPVRLDDLIEYVRRQHPEGDALERLSDAVLVSEYLGELADHLIGHFVDQARRAGASWTDIGQSMGVTKQAVQKRFVTKRSDQDVTIPASAFARFTERARNVVVKAQEEARRFGAVQVGTEHLLLGILHEPAGLACRAIEALGVPADTVRERTVTLLGPSGESSPAHLPFSPEAKRVRDRTFQEALRLGHNYVGTEHILLGLLNEETEPGARVLIDLGLHRDRVEEWVVETLRGMPRSASSGR